ncbi:MAG: PilZ domain-containing protein [Oscillospiraceae bacterium]|nr:PilZ domain-containing protein [Oscillospiraceae bacterium]
MMFNKRRFIRCSYCYDAAMRTDGEEWKEIAVENISAGGLNFFMRTINFEIGNELNFKLEVSAYYKNENIAYTTIAKGRIVRIVPGEDERFEYGVEFIEKDMSSLSQIIKFLMS